MVETSFRQEPCSGCFGNFFIVTVLFPHIGAAQVTLQSSSPNKVSGKGHQVALQNSSPYGFLREAGRCLVIDFCFFGTYVFHIADQDTKQASDNTQQVGRESTCKNSHPGNSHDQNVCLKKQWQQKWTKKDRRQQVCKCQAHGSSGSPMSGNPDAITDANEKNVSKQYVYRPAG